MLFINLLHILIINSNSRNKSLKYIPQKGAKFPRKRNLFSNVLSAIETLSACNNAFRRDLFPFRIPLERKFA